METCQHEELKRKYRFSSLERSFQCAFSEQFTVYTDRMLAV